jgi:hypothetical protein
VVVVVLMMMMVMVMISELCMFHKASSLYIIGELTAECNVTNKRRELQTILTLKGCWSVQSSTASNCLFFKVIREMYRIKLLCSIFGNVPIFNFALNINIITQFMFCYRGHHRFMLRVLKRKTTVACTDL